MPLAIASVNFNPRSDERSDQTRRDLSNLKQISIHAPTNGATSAVVYAVRVAWISIHAPTNGATVLRARGLLRCIFQSTLRRTERHNSVLHHLSNSLFQSTLRRTERRISSVISPFTTDISIHAPTNGATIHLGCHLFHRHISIHAPTNGATISVLCGFVH